MGARRAPLAVAVAALALSLTACGGGSENASEPLPKAPKLTVPGEKGTPEVTPRSNTDTTATETTTTETAVTTTPTQTTPAATSDPSTDQGGAAAPQTGGATPDSEQNDTAPPDDSPASKFEQFCADNPGAC